MVTIRDVRETYFSTFKGYYFTGDGAKEMRMVCTEYLVGLMMLLMFQDIE